MPEVSGVHYWGTYPALRVRNPHRAESVSKVLDPILKGSGVWHQFYGRDGTVVINPTAEVRKRIRALKGVELEEVTVPKTSVDHARETHPEARLIGMAKDGFIESKWRSWMAIVQPEGRFGSPRVIEGDIVEVHMDPELEAILKERGVKVEWVQ